MKLENITTSHNANAMNRRYSDACAMAHGLELIGDRWALLVVREMLLGPRRFTGLRRGLPGISANVLTQRLEELEARGIVTRLSNSEGQQVYGLTAWGMQLRPVVDALSSFGLSSPWHDPLLAMSATSFLLSLSLNFIAERAPGERIVANFDLQPDHGHAVVTPGELRVGRGFHDHPDFTLSGTPNAMLYPIYGKMPLAGAEAGGLLTCTGDRAKAAAFMDCISLPDAHRLKGVLGPQTGSAE